MACPGGRLALGSARLLSSRTYSVAILNSHQKLLASPPARRELHSAAFLGNSAIPRAQYGGRHRAVMLPGDGVGPEMMNHVKEVFRFAGAPVDFEEVQLDHTSSDSDYDYAVLALKRNGVALKGNVESMYKQEGHKSRNVEFRTELDLFANVMWCRSMPGIQTRHNNIDVIIIRENTEGEYSQLEHEVRKRKFQ